MAHSKGIYFESKCLSFLQSSVCLYPGDVSQSISQYSPLQHTVHSRTQHVINAVATATTVASRLKRLEDLLQHFYQFPEAKMYAAKVMTGFGNFPLICYVLC